jgi:hypothetical protein
MVCSLTLDGRKMLAKLARGDSDAMPLLYIGIGDGTTELSPYQYTMEHEIATRVLATITVPSTNHVLLIAQFAGLTEGDSYSEFGVFDSLVGGVMFSRHLPLEGAPAELTAGTVREVPSDGIVNARVRYNVVQGTY